MADFLPDEDRLLAPFGDTASVPENDVLRFVLVKRKTDSLSSPWAVPARDEFNKRINTATTRALAGGCLASYAWADPKRGNIALYAASRHGMVLFRETPSPHRTQKTSMKPTYGRVWSKNSR